LGRVQVVPGSIAISVRTLYTYKIKNQEEIADA